MSALSPLTAVSSIAEGVIVDSLLGTGLHGEMRQPYGEAIQTDQ